MSKSAWVVASSINSFGKGIVSQVAVIGGGPAGLMAAEVLSHGGASVALYDAMPSVGRKFLLAGRGGLNLTHAEPLDAFISRYASQSAQIAPFVRRFGPAQVRDWAQGLGIETFVGSSQRVFPKDLRAAPLLRAWLSRLRHAGVTFHSRHRWTGWNTVGGLLFETPDGAAVTQATAIVLAMGGASWSRLGSDGAWVSALQARDVAIAPLQPANCGFDIQGGWSEYLRSRYAGQPVKPVALTFVDSLGRRFARQGEFVLTDTGIEGSLIYSVSALLRDEIGRCGYATVHLDLLPDKALKQVQLLLEHPRGSLSLSNHLHRRLGLHGLKSVLLHEQSDKSELTDTSRLAGNIKALPLTLSAPRPIDEAISTAGGVSFEAMNEQLMLHQLPGVFCAGEMLDWEAPTGGYLLTASMATGYAAAKGALDWLHEAV